jgi:hypothetical protein
MVQQALTANPLLRVLEVEAVLETLLRLETAAAAVLPAAVEEAGEQ